MAVGKHDLVAEVAAKTGLTKKDSLGAVEAILEVVQEALTNGESVRLQNFGTFKVVERAARNGRNPQTGEEIVIEARKVPVFKASDALKATVRG